MKPLYTAEKYTYYVAWSPDDSQCVGRCSEFPSLSHLADQPAGALAGIIDLVRGVLKDMFDNDEQAPTPLALSVLRRRHR
jgi:hypothetical protein